MGFVLARFVINQNIPTCFKNLLTRMVKNIVCFQRQEVVRGELTRFCFRVWEHTTLLQSSNDNLERHAIRRQDGKGPLSIADLISLSHFFCGRWAFSGNSYRNRT